MIPSGVNTQKSITEKSLPGKLHNFNLLHIKKLITIQFLDFILSSMYHTFEEPGERSWYTE